MNDPCRGGQKALFYEKGNDKIVSVATPDKPWWDPAGCLPVCGRPEATLEGGTSQTRTGRNQVESFPGRPEAWSIHPQVGLEGEKYVHFTIQAMFFQLSPIHAYDVDYKKSVIWGYY